MESQKSETKKNVCLALVGVFGMILSCVLYGILRDVYCNGQDSLGLLLTLYGFVPWAIATVIGISKRRGVFGFILGGLFSWLGVIVVGAFSSRKAA